MTGLMEKADILASKVEAWAVAAGRELEDIYEEIVAHIEGKTAEATSAKEEAPAETTQEAPQTGEALPATDAPTEADAPTGEPETKAEEPAKEEEAPAPEAAAEPEAEKVEAPQAGDVA